MTQPLKSEIQEFILKIQDEVLGIGDSRWIDFDPSSHGGVVDDLATEIDLAAATGTYILTGQSGTGKSSTLRRLQTRLIGLNMQVVYIDMSEALLLSDRVEIGDFLVSMVGAIGESLEIVTGVSAQKNYWQRIGDMFSREVDIKEFGFSLSGFNVKAGIKEDANFRHKFQRATRTRLRELRAAAAEHLAEHASTLDRMDGGVRRKIVVLVDSVEKLGGRKRGDLEVLRDVRDLFLNSGSLLIIPSFHMVYTVPPYLPILVPGLQTAMGVTIIRRLTCIKVLRKGAERVSDSIGIGLLRSMLSARFAEWNGFLTEEAMAEIAIGSGGDLRSFLKHIVFCVNLVIRKSTGFPFGVTLVRDAHKEIRDGMGQLFSTDLDRLVRIKASNEHCLETEEEIPHLAHLLENKLVLTYKNGETWYGVHPLIRDMI